MTVCPHCSQQLETNSRYCTQCGSSVVAAGRATEEMCVPILYAMVVLLVVALLFPPWETASDQPPEFLGFGFILKPPASGVGKEGVISRLLLTIELVTIAAGGVYFAWLFRKKT